MAEEQRWDVYRQDTDRYFMRTPKDRLQKWVAQGKLVATDTARPVGEKEWQPIVNMPELADLFTNTLPDAPGLSIEGDKPAQPAELPETVKMAPPPPLPGEKQKSQPPELKEKAKPPTKSRSKAKSSPPEIDAPASVEKKPRAPVGLPKGKTIPPFVSAAGFGQSTILLLGVVVLLMLMAIPFAYGVLNSPLSAASLYLKWLLYGTVMLVAIGLIMRSRWLWMVRKNLPAFSVRKARYPENWAPVALWIPLIQSFLPLLILDEVWRASNPNRIKPVSDDELDEPDLSFGSSPSAAIMFVLGISVISALMLATLLFLQMTNRGTEGMQQLLLLVILGVDAAVAGGWVYLILDVDHRQQALANAWQLKSAVTHRTRSGEADRRLRSAGQAARALEKASQGAQASAIEPEGEAVSLDDLEFSGGDDQWKPKREKDDDAIDLTPMIDVTFQLLIFFMVTNTLQQQNVAKQPEAKHGIAMASTSTLVITVLKGDGGQPKYVVGDYAGGDLPPKTLDQIINEVKDKLTNTPDVVIKADRNLASKHVIELQKRLASLTGGRVTYGVAENK